MPGTAALRGVKRQELTVREYRWGTYTYYLVLVAQQVLGLSALETGVQLIPFSVWGE